jgi:hypothetical protein
VGANLTRCRCADGAKDAGANHGADRKHDQITGTQGAS